MTIAAAKYTIEVPGTMPNDALEWCVRILQINGVRAGVRQDPSVGGGPPARFLLTQTPLPQADRGWP